MVQVIEGLTLKPPLGQFFEKSSYRKVYETICLDLHH